MSGAKAGKVTRDEGTNRWRDERGRFAKAPDDASLPGPVGSSAASVQLSREEQKQAKDLLRIWDGRVTEQAKQLESLASEALRVDAEVTDGEARIGRVLREQAALRARQEASDRSVDLVLDQQKSLVRLLSSLQDALDPGVGSAEAMAGPRRAPEQRASDLQVQATELHRQVRLLEREATDFQASRYSEPLVRVGRVLDEHACELDMIQARVLAAERELATMEGAL